MAAHYRLVPRCMHHAPRSLFPALSRRMATNTPTSVSPSQTPPHPVDLKSYGEYLVQLMPRYIQRVSLYKDELTLYCSPCSLIPLMTFLRDHSNCHYKSLMDIAGVDYPTRSSARFEVVYHLLSIRYNARLRVKTYASETSSVPSLTGLFSSANWFEREVWDMFGILFSGHPDLRRILTDYGFEGHPFRKDFPLTGYTEVRYDDEKKRVIVEPLEMTQEYRKFDLGSPWEQVPSKNVVSHVKK